MKGTLCFLELQNVTLVRKVPLMCSNFLSFCNIDTDFWRAIWKKLPCCAAIATGCMENGLPASLKSQWEEMYLMYRTCNSWNMHKITKMHSHNMLTVNLLLSKLKIIYSKPLLSYGWVQSSHLSRCELVCSLPQEFSLVYSPLLSLPSVCIAPALGNSTHVTYQFKFLQVSQSQIRKLAISSLCINCHLLPFIEQLILSQGHVLEVFLIERVLHSGEFDIRLLSHLI